MPGVRPLNWTTAGWPATVTVGSSVVRARGEDGAGSPVAGWLLTGPRPLA